MHKLVGLAVIVLSACASVAPPRVPADLFMARLQSLCGKAFEGKVVTTDAADAAMRSQRLVMHVRECDPGEVRIPFHVGEDRSRTWIVTRTGTGLRLKHDHRHQDGSPDELSMYGGDTAAPGTPERQEFPADAESIALFTRSVLWLSLRVSTRAMVSVTAWRSLRCSAPSVNMQFCR